MPKLLGSNGQSVEILLDGYQFPGHSGDEWDANWLNVTVRVTTGDRHWVRTDPALLTWELCSLVSWLRGIREESPKVDPSIDFTEPCLALALKADGGAPRLVVELALEFSESRKPPAEGDEIVFPLKGLDTESMASGLEECLRQFPIRILEKRGAAVHHLERHGCGKRA